MLRATISMYYLIKTSMLEPRPTTQERLLASKQIIDNVLSIVRSCADDLPMEKCTKYDVDKAEALMVSIGNLQRAVISYNEFMYEDILYSFPCEEEFLRDLIERLQIDRSLEHDNETNLELFKSQDDINPLNN